MKVHYASDLHLEFPENRQWLHDHPLQGKGGVLVLAGDVLPFGGLQRHRDEYIRWGDQYDHVLWLPGNHEYYGGDINQRSGKLDEQLTSNVRLLNEETWYAPGLRILCATLWTRISPTNEALMRRYMADYQEIRDGGFLLQPQTTTALHTAALTWLQTELDRPFDGQTVVVTHHVPTFQHYPPEYVGTALSSAFASPLDDLVARSGASAWIYGHHHHNTPLFHISGTRMLTNQLGYVQHGEGRGFDTGAHIDITTE